MKSKLTLSIESELIKKAKDFAVRNGTSLSGILEGHLKSLLSEKELSPSDFLLNIPAKKPSYPIDNQTDEEWLQENLEI